MKYLRYAIEKMWLNIKYKKTEKKWEKDKKSLSHFFFHASLVLFIVV